MDKTLNIIHRVMVIFGGICILLKRRMELEITFGSLNLQFSILLLRVFTTRFVIVSYSDIDLWLEEVAVWTTVLMINVFLGICLVFKNKFGMFLEKVIFKDEILTMPFIEHIMEREHRGKELKKVIEESHEKLFKYTKILIYIFWVPR